MKKFARKYFSNPAFPALCILSVLVYFTNYAQALPNPNGGVVAAASAANAIDRHRSPVTPGPALVPIGGSGVRRPQRRQHYRPPASPLAWIAQYFAPENWRFLDWPWQTNNAASQANPWRRQYVSYDSYGK